jgi:hypothetical protein
MLVVDQPDTVNKIPFRNSQGNPRPILWPIYSADISNIFVLFEIVLVFIGF